MNSQPYMQAFEAHAPSRSRRSARLPFLDWTRGLAATIMLQGHVFHAFVKPELRDSGPYILSQFVGGIAPAIFLFLAGVTLSFMMHRMEQKRLSPVEKFTGALRRAGYLAALAFAFRFQLYLFGLPYSSLSDLLKVDILNCMGLAMLTVAGCALLTTAQRVHAGVVIGILIAVLSPLVSLIPSEAMPHVVRMYLSPDAHYFSYFPWAAFLAFGVSAGAVLRLVQEDQMHRVMQWAAILGFGIILSSQHFSNLPYSLYPSVDFWINSPGLTFIKLGVILVILAVTFLWTHHGAGEGWSWVRQLGTTSLLVYWVHIELVYGRWFGFWKENLTVAQCTLAALTLILMMIALSYSRTNGNLRMPRLNTMWSPEPRRVSGD